jgi:hypothetical protein
MADDCTRVRRVVRAWARVPADVPLGTERVLSDLWLQSGSSLPFCDNAVSDLIDRIIAEFRELDIRMRANDFCPAETATVKTVGDLCMAVSQSEPR